MTIDHAWPIDRIRQQFPALRRTVNGSPAVFLDGAAGSQVPQCVADAVSSYLLRTNANRNGVFATANESDTVLDAAHEVLADFIGTTDPHEICFGANTTTITFQVSRALSKQWKQGDEVIVCRGDHDANFTPWILAARDAGTVVKFIELHPDDATLDLDSLRRHLSPRTRLVAVGGVGNATGTINPIAEISHLVHGAGALLYIDAVHFAPHGRINVNEFGCDFLVCSAYKFFGPHVGIFWGRRSLLEHYEPYKLRPASDTLPSRWMTGTQCHEGIAGAAAAVEYLASLGESDDDVTTSGRSAQLDSTLKQIVAYEQTLSERLLTGCRSIPGLKIHGIRDSHRLSERVPTVSITFEAVSPKEMAGRLAEEGIFVWAGNHYAQPFTEAAGLEPDGTLRISALHYNTADEIDQVVNAVRRHAQR